jgi:hypothetical protein
MNRNGELACEHFWCAELRRRPLLASILDDCHLRGSRLLSGGGARHYCSVTDSLRASRLPAFLGAFKACPIICFPNHFHHDRLTNWTRAIKDLLADRCLFHALVDPGRRTGGWQTILVLHPEHLFWGTPHHNYRRHRRALEPIFTDIFTFWTSRTGSTGRCDSIPEETTSLLDREKSHVAGRSHAAGTSPWASDGSLAIRTDSKSYIPELSSLTTRSILR